MLINTTSKKGRQIELDFVNNTITIRNKNKEIMSICDMDYFWDEYIEYGVNKYVNKH